MALIQIPNQPVVLNPQDDCPDCDTRCFCQKYSNDDYLYWQGKQGICNEIELCGFPDYGDLGEENLITNGTFDSDATGWTFDPDGWAWSSGTMFMNYAGLTGLYLAQSTSMQYGHKYRISFTVSDWSLSEVRWRLSNGIDEQVGTFRGADGTYTDDVYVLISGPIEFQIEPQIGFTGKVDDISVYEFEYIGDEFCFEIDNNSIVLGDNKICHTPPLETNLTIASIVESGKYYKVQIKISGTTAGSVTVKLGTVASDALINNQVYESWITSDGTDLTITMSEDFDGCIEYIRLYRLKNDYYAALLNDSDNNTALVITSYITYYQDWITIKAKWGDLDIEDGCYKLAIYNDCCGDCMVGDECNMICNGDFAISAGKALNSDMMVSCPGVCPPAAEGYCWEQAVSGDICSQICATGSWVVTFNDTDPATAYIQQVADICLGRTYRVTFDYDSDVAFTWKATIENADGPISDISSTDEVAGTGTVTETVMNENCFAETPPQGPFYIRITILSAAQVGTVEISNVSVQMQAFNIATDCPDYVSNCLCFKSSVDCKEKIIMGYADSAAYGFEFANTGFRLQVRTIFALDKPSYDTEETSYVYSNGTRELSFSQVEKYQTLFIEQVDAITHDTISVIRLLKHFYLGDKNDTLTEYIAKKGDYQPEWIKDEYLRLAPSRFDVSKKGSIGFLTNC